MLGPSNSVFHLFKSCSFLAAFLFILILYRFRTFLIANTDTMCTRCTSTGAAALAILSSLSILAAFLDILILYPFRTVLIAIADTISTNAVAGPILIFCNLTNTRLPIHFLDSECKQSQSQRNQKCCLHIPVLVCLIKRTLRR